MEVSYDWCNDILLAEVTTLSTALVALHCVHDSMASVSEARNLCVLKK